MKKIDSFPCAFACAIVVAVALNFLCLTTDVHAQATAEIIPDVPHTISYQGLLESADGQKIDGLRTITTRIYADAAGTKLLWEDEFAANVRGGTFDLSLGAQKPLPDISKLGGSLWMGVSVGNDAEMHPLQQLTVAPYALTVANGAITSAKMGTDYVSSISINGERVTSRGSNLNLIAGDGILLAYDPSSSTVALRSTGRYADGKGANVQSQNQDLDMNGHNILNTPIYMAGAAGTTTGALRLYTNSNSNYATITSAAQGANRTYTIPDAGADATFVMQTGAQTISGVKTFSSGAAMGNALNMSSNRITNVSAPTTSSDAATKAYVDAINTTLTTAINQEVTNRQTAVTSEASARTAADNTLTTSINSEASRAQAAEATLTSSVTSESSRAQGAESTLTTNLGSEITNRQSAVTAEASTRSSADNTLTTDLNGEISRAQSAESTLTTNLSSEIANRQSAVTDEASARTSADNTLTTNLNGEIARAQGAEATLTTNLSLETTNRQSAVTAEASARIAADNTLTTNLNSEITNRTNAVAAEALIRAGAVSTLTTNLSSEITNRTNAVTSEANTRSAADNVLTGSINNEIGRATTEENALQTQIDAISLPQDLSTTAAPTFDGLTLSGGSPLYNYGLLGQFSQSYFFGDLSIFANIVMGGTIDAGFQPIIDVPDPSSAQDAVNKNYVDVIADAINSELSTHSTSIDYIDSLLGTLNPISKNYNNAANGTYTAHSVSISGNTTNVVNLIGYGASASGSDDHNIGIQATGSGVGSATSIGGDFTASNSSSSGYAIGGRFAASGAANNIAVQATAGSIQIQTAGEGIILKSPNGTCYKLTVNNDGTLSTSAITCP